MPNASPYAHSRNNQGQRQGLREHLEAVAELAALHASPFGGAQLARVVGLWHDLGKFDPDFQQYLLESEAGTRRRGTGPTHKAAGALLASERCGPLAFLIAGHHGGLLDRSALLEKLTEWNADPAHAAALRLVPPDLLQPNLDISFPDFVQSPSDTEFFLRLLFSALVDADFLDTEQHFGGKGARGRAGAPTLLELWQRFERSHALLPLRHDPVGLVRSEVYEACLRAADLAPGLFRLTVPTGGGKTLSSLAFALRHCLQHGGRRVIVAVPYTSITEQTAGIYREVLGDNAVLEHHSAIDPRFTDEQTPEGLWGRLASENWDTPVVVTTTVQLFESLFARSTSKCRKLHRLAGSTIVIDEAQTLPSHLLDPILGALRSLTSWYGTSVVLCTATQPALDDAPGFRGLSGVREIVPDAHRHFAVLRRVHYEVQPEDVTWSWERAAEEMETSESALAIVNTVADSLALYDALDDPDALYLSTLLCGAHRRQVLAEIRRRLKAGEPCRLVSTQVVEAGVDVDFPLVLRAFGPLERIVQAAGRCNREGALAVGRVVVFRPTEGKLPMGTYRTATDQTSLLLREATADLDDPQLYQRYFESLFRKLDLDDRNIESLRAQLCYEEVAKKFRLIDDDTVNVAVAFDDGATALLSRFRPNRTPTSSMFRELQAYLVSVRRSRLTQYQDRGLVMEIVPGLYEWLGEYDSRRGLRMENRPLMV